MLPTKGYFQDIECPYFNSSCGRPYCHFRHRKKQSEHVEEVVAASENEATQVIPTYKPTPKSQLADIHNNRSHIPISYVPDLAFRPDKKFRQTSKIENLTYKPTPLSILSSVNKRDQCLSEKSKEDIEVINEIKQNIANVEYDPTISLQSIKDIDFEDLSNEFDLIDEIINTSDKGPKIKAEVNIINEGNKSNILTDKSHQTTEQDSVIQKESGLSQISGLNNKTEKNTVLKETDSKIKVEAEVREKSKNHEKKSNSNSKSENDKVSSHKKHKKEKDRSPSQESIKKKHNSKSKHKSTEKESEAYKKDKKDTEKESEAYKKDKKDTEKESEAYKKDKKDTVSHHSDTSEHSEKSKNNNESSKRKHSSVHKSKDKEKEKNKSDSSKSKEEKGHVKDSDKTNHRRNSEREKASSKSKDHKNKKIENSDNEKKSSRSKEHKSSKKEKGDKERHDNKNTEHKNCKKEKSHKESSHVKNEKCKYDKDSERKSVKKEEKDKEKYKQNQSEESSTYKKAPIMEVNENKIDILYSNESDSDSDIDINEDETMLECYRIFNEYKPTEVTSTSQGFKETESSTNNNECSEYQGKKRIAHASFDTLFGSPKHFSQPKVVQTPGQILVNRYRLAKEAQANREQELLMNEVQQTVLTKRPPPSLLEAARERKRMREMERPKNVNLIDDILKGSKTVTYTPTQKLVSKKIAPVHNVLAITKAKERISHIKPSVTVKTIAQTQKGSSRTAHVPDISLSDIPDVLELDKSKLPVNVRTRFLTMLADECVKLYISKEEAYSRALKEEFNCYEKCKVLTSYRNSAMLAVNRLRKEIQERIKTGLGLIGIDEDTGKDSRESNLSQFYNKIKKWVLTEEELDIHGYPRQTDEYGVAVVKNFKSNLPSNLDENQRICCRCHKLYHVDDDGWPLFEEECCYHPLKKRTIRGEQTYLCCRSNDETGCATSDTHVSDGFTSAKLEGFQTTIESEYEDDTRSYAVYALDCEMCYTTKGLELTRVTVVDSDCKTVYESLVKPLNPIIDYNTRFSGITKEQMDKTSTSILQVQANILHLCNSMTILVGHSLESDMKALKIVHGMVIDTSVLFPHKMGLPHKRALKALASEYLRKIIQNDLSGHDSAEDAITCMELLKWKLNQENKGIKK